MKSFKIGLILSILLFTAACAAPVPPAQTPAPSQTAISALPAAPTSLSTAASIPTAAPTATPTQLPPAPGELIAYSGHGTLNDLAFSPDGNYIFAAYSAGVAILESADLREAAFHPLPDGAQALALFSDGQQFALGSLFGDVHFGRFDPQSASITMLAQSLDARPRQWSPREYPNQVLKVAVAPDGKTVAAASGNQVQFWSLPGGQPLLPNALTTKSSNFSGIQFSANSRYAQVVSNVDRDNAVIDLQTGKSILNFKQPGQFLGKDQFVSAHKDFTSQQDRYISQVLSLADGSVLKEYSLSGNPFQLLLSPDGTTLAALFTQPKGAGKEPRQGVEQVAYTLPGTSKPGNYDIVVQLTDTRTGTQAESSGAGYLSIPFSVQMVGNPENFLFSGDWLLGAYQPGDIYDPSSQYFAISGDNLRSRDIKLPFPTEKTLIGDRQECRMIVSADQRMAAFFNPSGLLLLHANADQALRLIDNHPAALTALAFSADGQVLAAGRADTSAQLFSLTGGFHVILEQSFEINPGLSFRAPGGIGGIIFDPSDQTFAFASPSSHLHWLAASGNSPAPVVSNPRGGATSFIGLAISPQTNTVAIGGYDNAVRLRPLQAQDAGSDILLEDSSAVSAVSYASDGLLLAAGTEKGVIRLWNSETRALERSLKGHSQWVSGLGFAPDGGKLYSISEDGSARIWNVSDGSQAQLLELNEPATSMALDPLGLFWAIGTRSGRVYFWDLQKAQWAGSLHIGAQPILALAFSPDGATLALGDQSGQLQLWLVRSETGQVAVFPAGDPQNTGVLASGVCTPYNSSVAAAQQGGVLMADSTTRLDWEFSYSGDCSALAAASLAGSADQPDLNEITLRHTPHSSGGYDRLHISAVINLPKVPRDYEYTWELHAPGKTTTLTAKFTLIKPAKVNLPAPLYFVSEDSALLRLETDGRTQTPVIEASVQCMDISADGQIAYLSEDSLMLADANGGERRALLPIAGCPAWSPDGTRIAYVLNGVKVLDIASGEIKTLDMDVHAYGTNVRRYRSIVEWSPNNDKLIASVSGWEFWGNVLFDINTGEHFGLQGETVTWSRDGALVYSARPMLSCYDGSTPSLLRTNVSTQEVETLLGNSETDLTGSFKPYETPDGRLMAFVDHDQGEMDCSGDIDVNLMLFPAQVSLNAPGEYRADQAISVLVSQLRDVLWWRDGSAAILSLAEDAQPFSATYQLVQPFAGADSRYLPIRGKNLRWAP